MRFAGGAALAPFWCDLELECCSRTVMVIKATTLRIRVLTAWRPLGKFMVPDFQSGPNRDQARGPVAQ